MIEYGVEFTCDIKGCCERTVENLGPQKFGCPTRSPLMPKDWAGVYNGGRVRMICPFHWRDSEEALGG